MWLGKFWLMWYKQNVFQGNGDNLAPFCFFSCLNADTMAGATEAILVHEMLPVYGNHVLRMNKQKDTRRQDTRSLNETTTPTLDYLYLDFFR